MYDLNIAWSPSTTTQDLERMLSHAGHLGYHTVALTHTIQTPVPNEHKSPLPPLPTTPHPTQPTTSSSTDANDTTRKPSLPVVLHRVTLSISAEVPPNYRLAALTQQYHLVALRPQTERALLSACITAADAPLISLDLTQRLPFLLRPKTVMAAVSRGVRFEICYARAIAAPDSRARATFLSNVTNLVRATSGRGIVVSSGAGRALDLRAPVDVVNLLAVWGLGTEKGMEGLGVGPRGIVVNEGLQRRGFRGVVEVVKVAAGGPPPPEKKGDRGKDKSGKNQQQQQQQQQQGQGKKNKNKKRKGGVEHVGQRPDKKQKTGQEAKG